MLVTKGLADEDKDRYLRLNIGTPELKDKILSVSPNNLYEMSTGQPIEFSRMIDSMMTSRFIYVGETHNSLPMHDIQLKVIQAMYKKDRQLAIGLEMIPITLQHVLDKWSLGILTEEELIQDTAWYETWNFNYKFYEKIFDFAKLNKIPLYGLNVPKVLITKIRMKGWDALTDDEKKIVPQPDVSNKEHRTLIRTIFESSELPHEMKGPGLGMMFEGLYRAQSAWDESMAYYASQASDLSERRIIVLAGSGHLLFNLGISRRAYERNGSPYKTVICLEIPQDKATLRVSQSLADYVWALNEEVHPIFPSIGLSFKKFEGLKNLVIEREPIDGVAKGGNFAKGDIILSVDGKTFTEINALRIYLSKFRWKDEAKFHLLRDAKEHEVVLKFLPHDDVDLED
ncbi:MAG: ChaN family lipoprotein [Candidatus Aminicenantes bacterium]|jgi:uncharacterized iron-regulated protein